eukprot:s8451_g3.t1
MKKPQAKKATKAKQREQRKKQREEKAKLKQQTKAATKLPKVIQTYDANSHKVDRDYIVEMLEANPSWVPKLASVIRQGGMKILMDIEKADCENNAPQVDFGEKWKGKNVRTLLGMPINVLISMVMSTLPEDAEEPLRDDEWWQAAFCYQMHCTKDTPLPADKMNRYIIVMEEYARLRVAAIGNRLTALRKPLKDMQMDDFVIYKIQKAENPSNDNEKPNALVLLNTITNESNELPALKSHQGPWAVKDGRDPETFVTANECPLQFKARDYFPRMPVACAKWDYFVDAHAVALVQAGGE